MASTDAFPTGDQRPGDTAARDHDVISSDHVEGTAVYHDDGERLGSISHLVIGKRDGRVRYAVMSFGGFLGIGNDYYPLPWQMLRYDPDKGGYAVSIGKDRLHDAPRYRPDDRPSFDEVYANNIYGYYGVTPFY